MTSVEETVPFSLFPGKLKRSKCPCLDFGTLSREDDTRACNCSHCLNLIRVDGIKVCNINGFAPMVPDHDSCDRWG